MKRIFHVRPAFDCPSGRCSVPGCPGYPAHHGRSHGRGSEEWQIGVSDGLVGVSLNLFTPFLIDGGTEDEPTRGAYLTMHVGFAWGDSVADALSCTPEKCDLLGECWQPQTTSLGADEFWRAHGVEPIRGGQPDARVWSALEERVELLRDKVLPRRLDDPTTAHGRAFLAAREAARVAERAWRVHLGLSPEPPAPVEVP